MDTPITHINLFNAMLALYVIGYQISICSDWSWIPMNKEDYQEKLHSGADLVQIYTGFIYEGPSLISDILEI